MNETNIRSLPIQERFVSIQGEGTLVGTPSSFIRVSGCNLRCTWCDSPNTSWTPTGTRTTIPELVEFCAAGPHHVVLTGGEPMLFRALVPLSQTLAEAGHHVTVETAGTRLLDELSCDLMSVSPKLTNSTPWQRAPELAARHDAERIAMATLSTLLARNPWQLKFVVGTGDADSLARDLEEVDDLVTALQIQAADRGRILLMPEAIEEETVMRGYSALLEPCRERGFRLGQRLHIELFGHRPGT